jgi:Membrane-associated lipoprotein involved in thiamine biosynthesis
MIVLDKLKTYNYFFKAQLTLGFLLCFNGCGQQKHISQITGQSMGTTYSIKIAQNMNETTIHPLKNGVDSVLHQINKQMSTWDPQE